MTLLKGQGWKVSQSTKQFWSFEAKQCFWKISDKMAPYGSSGVIQVPGRPGIPNWFKKMYFFSAHLAGWNVGSSNFWKPPICSRFYMTRACILYQIDFSTKNVISCSHYMFMIMTWLSYQKVAELQADGQPSRSHSRLCFNLCKCDTTGTAAFEL